MLPDWLAEYIIPPGEKDPNSDIPVIELDLPGSTAEAMAFLRAAEPAIEGQNGDDHTYMTIQRLRDFGLSEEGMFEALDKSGWNERCDPPWSDGELDSKIRNAWAYGQNRPGIKSPEYQVQCLTQARPAGGYAATISDADIAERFHPTAHLTVVVDNTAVEVDPEIPQDVYEDGEHDPNESEEEQNIWEGFEEFRDNPEIREYVVADWLIDYGITHLIAKRGTGKSTIALDIACHIACDMEWCGTPVAPGWKVIYICGEDTQGMRLNCRAWCAEHVGISPTNERFRIANNVISLNNDTILNQRIAEMMDWVGLDEDGEPNRAVVILDTWQRATSGESKNDDAAMEAAIKRAERVARHVHGPLLSLVHPPKDGRMTVVGAGVQENTTSGLWKLEKDKAGVNSPLTKLALDTSGLV